MDLLRELFDWVGDTIPLAKADEWHCGAFPPEAADDHAVAVLLERPGTPSLPKLRGNVGEFMFQVLTVGAVNTSRTQVSALAHRVHDLLQDCAGVNLGEWRASVIEAIQEPYSLGGDERYRFQYSANYAVRAIKTATWWAV
jgi:hypothetical protein